MSAELAIVQERQRAHLMFLVSEKKLDYPMICLSIYTYMDLYIITILNMGQLSSSISFINDILLRKKKKKFSLSLPTYPTAQPYNAEFYFDTPNPVRILKGNNYSYNLQWTQKDPEATDYIIGYWVNVRKVKHSYKKSTLKDMHPHTDL